MGSGAAKQPHTRKIYVKSKDDVTCDEEEDRSIDLGTSVSSSAAPTTYDEQIKLIKSASEQPTGQIPPLPPLQRASSPAGDITMPVSRPRAAMEAQEWPSALEDVKPRVVGSTSAKPGNAKKPAHEVIEVESVELDGKVYNLDSDKLSPRSVSSDEGDLADPLPEVIPKIAFAEVLREGYKSRAQERQNWLKSFGDATFDHTAPKADNQAFGTSDKRGLGLDATRRPPPALRDPDIFEQVRKWNVSVHRDEIPHCKLERNIVSPREAFISHLI